METIWPNGGVNKMWEPIHILLNLHNPLNLAIIGRTDGRDGCKISLLDSSQQILESRYYTQEMGSTINRNQITKDFINLIELINDIEGLSTNIVFNDLYPAVKELVDKCESRYGNPIPGIDYEGKIFFQPLNN